MASKRSTNQLRQNGKEKQRVGAMVVQPYFVPSGRSVTTYPVGFLREIGLEIHRLKKDQGRRELIESERTKLEILRQGGSDSPGLDRLLRYASCLERDFDRTLTNRALAADPQGAASLASA